MPDQVPAEGNYETEEFCSANHDPGKLYIVLKIALQQRTHSHKQHIKSTDIVNNIVMSAFFIDKESKKMTKHLEKVKKYDILYTRNTFDLNRMEIFND